MILDAMYQHCIKRIFDFILVFVHWLSFGLYFLLLPCGCILPIGEQVFSFFKIAPEKKGNFLKSSSIRL